MEEKRFTLRVKSEIFEKVEKSAKVNKRSIAKEIEYILEQYFADRDLKMKEK